MRTTCRLERLDMQGYSQDGRYFGVPYRDNGDLMRVYRITTARGQTFFMRARNRQEALELGADKMDAHNNYCA